MKDVESDSTPNVDTNHYPLEVRVKLIFKATHKAIANNAKPTDPKDEERVEYNRGMRETISNENAWAYPFRDKVANPEHMMETIRHTGHEHTPAQSETENGTELSVTTIETIETKDKAIINGEGEDITKELTETIQKGSETGQEQSNAI